MKYLLISFLLTISAFIQSSNLEARTEAQTAHAEEVTSIAQTVLIRSDKETDVTVNFKVNAAAKADLENYKKTLNNDMGRTFRELFAPQSSAIVHLNVKKDKELTVFEAQLKSAALISSSKPMPLNETQIHPSLALKFIRPGSGNQLVFDRLASLDMTTEINTLVIDPIDHECHIRSPWFDFDRILSASANGTSVVEHARLKRLLAPSAIGTSEMDRLILEFNDCMDRGALNISADSSKPTAQDASKGPAVEKMGDSDVKTLEMNGSGDLGPYVRRKLYRYYSLKIVQHANRPRAFKNRANLLVKIAHWSDSWSPAYLEEALVDLQRALALSKDHADPELLGNEIRILIPLNKKAEAAEVFKTLARREPKGFNTCYSAYLLNLKDNKLEAAGSWISLALPAAKDAKDRTLALRALVQLLEQQKKYQEALKFVPELEKTSSDAKDYHLIARIYCQLSDYDRCIEYEKKALAKWSTVFARNQLSQAYFEKAIGSPKSGPGAVELLYREALKWNDQNDDASTALAAVIYQKVSMAKGNPQDLNEGRSLLQNVLKRDPRNTKALELMATYDRTKASNEKRPK